MPNKNKLLARLLGEIDKPRHIEGIYMLAREGEPANPVIALGIPKEVISDNAKEALDAINELAFENASDWIDFRWKLTAFAHLPEIFDAVLYDTENPLVWFQQYYFYFESRIILAESMLAGLNGLYVASDALLRPFLEFTLLQNYHYRVSRRAGRYSLFEDYLKKGRNPSWNSVLKKAIPDDPFCHPVRFRIQSHLAGLSDSSNHPYHPSFSATQYRQSLLGHSLEGLFFWQKARLVLEAALWVYYVNFPLLFHPIDVLRKFGFNSPVGVAIDKTCGEAIKHSLSSTDYEAFRSYSLAQRVTTDILDWINSRPDLTDAQILASWNEKDDGPCPGMREGYCIQMAKMAVLRAAMAFPQTKSSELPQKLVLDTESLAGWKRIMGLRKGSHIK